MAEQPNITAILAALAAQQRSASTQPQQAAPPTYQPQQQPQYQQPPPQNMYAAPQYGLPQPSNSGSLDLSNIKPVNSGSVSIADAVAKARAIAAERGVIHDRPQYGPPGGRQRTRSRSPPRRDAFRSDFGGQNPYRDERRNDRPPPSRDMYGRERSFSPGRGRNGPGAGSGGAFSPPRGNVYGRDRSPARRAGGDDGSLETIQIESHLVGLIIGRQGENLRRVESETGCRVQFITGPDETGPYRQCKITGPAQRRQDAKNEINRIIDESGMGSNVRTVQPPTRGPPAQNERAGSHQPALRDGEDSMQIMVPDRTVGLIIGRGGETIRDLQERSGCHVNIVGENKSVNGLRPVNLIGSREAAAKAKDLIMEIVESDSKSQSEKRANAPGNDRGQQRDGGFAGVPAYGSVGGGGGGADNHDSIYVPSDAVGMIIGKGGETIKDMQNTTNCKINVTQSNGAGETEREIKLVGTRECIAAAKQAIMEKVDAVQAKNNGQGGGQRRGGHRDLDYDPGNNSRGYQQQQQQPYGAQPGQAVAGQGAQVDPYAQYGGYEAYMALWYQAMAAQNSGQGAAPGQPPGAA